MATHKTPFLPVLAWILMLGQASCNDGSKTTGDLSKNNSNSVNARKPAADKPQTGTENYWGEDWASGPLSGGAKNQPQSTGASGASGGAKAGVSTAAASPPAKPATPSAPNPASFSGPTSTWSLVLGTYSGEGHAEAANQMIAGLRTIAPQVKGARIHTTPKGSMVVYGNYTGRDDPNAKDDEQRLKAIMYQNRPVFNRVMLTRLDLRSLQQQFHPYDLLSARRAHPKVDPLYTLEIAIWMSNDDEKAGDRVTFDEVKRRAEAQVQQLRSQGVEAYFYHDEINQRSEVTVGLFDRRAINPVSGMYNDEVRALVKRFPERHANGEIMYEPVAVRKDNDPHAAKMYKRPQTPVLVLVPLL